MRRGEGTWGGVKLCYNESRRDKNNGTEGVEKQKGREALDGHDEVGRVLFISADAYRD
jgi:hypothetical protein